MASVYFAGLSRYAWVPVVCFLAALAIGFAARRVPVAWTKRLARVLPVALLTAALVAGLGFAWQKKSLYDDSFISFRYARNLLAGNGLVYNLGERVEGYTNFGWTVLVAGLTRVTGGDMPIVALFACLFCFAANLMTVFAIGRRLSAPEPGQVYVPIAVLWLALQHTFHSYATTGLETMFASWLVNLALWVLVSRDEPRGYGPAALLLILSTFARPDHALFFVCLCILAVWQTLTSGEPAKLRSFARKVIAMALPPAGYAAYLAWKLAYYGDVVPNTYYAKSAGSTYWTQGAVYGLVTVLSAHLAILLPLFVLWLATDRGAHVRRFRRFAGLSVFVYAFYVIRLGGDQMYCRFFQVLFPILLLGVERLIHQLARRGEVCPSRAGVVVCALVCATFYGVPMMGSCKVRWYLTDPGTMFSVRSLDPLVVGSRGGKSDRVERAKRMYEALTAKGIRPVIADGGIGMTGYFSELPLIDTNGLTDRFVASVPVLKRGKPGHEKNAPAAYLDHRNVRLARNKATGEARKYARFRIDGRKVSTYRLWRYDGALMETIAERSPEFSFTRFPAYLDHNRRRLIRGTPVKVARFLREFDHFYFSLNGDPERRAWFTDRFLRLECFETGQFPDGTQATGDFGFVRPADGDFLIESYQGESLIASGADGSGTGEVAFPAFRIEGDEIGILLGGGRDAKRVSARLEIGGRTRYRATGSDSLRLRFVRWDVSRWKGRSARVVLSDTSPDDRLLFDMLYEADLR